MKKNKQKAFTLLELLVVIAIIGILISLGVASFSNAQRKARDSRRRENIKSFQSGLEQHYSINTSYSTNTATNQIQLTGMYNNLTDGSQYFPAGVPVDPRNVSSPTDLRYRASYSSSAYCLCARLEIAGTGNATATATSTTCTYGTGGNFFCVSNLQ